MISEGKRKERLLLRSFLNPTLFVQGVGVVIMRLFLARGVTTVGVLGMRPKIVELQKERLGILLG